VHDIKRGLKAVAAIVTTLAMAGCTLPHSDVLVFATQTKVALDVSASPSTGAPSFTLGYKREEGVWMPLVVNGRESVALAGSRSCTPDGSRCWTVSSATLTLFNECVKTRPAEVCLGAVAKDVKYVGSAPGQKDAYSVFASFGGDFSAGGGGQAALAQFFATGIAAQRLAENPTTPNALKAEEPDAQVVTAQRDEIARLRAEGAALAAPATQATVTLIDKAVTCWNGQRNAYRQRAANEAGLNADLLTAIRGDDEGGFRTLAAMMINEHPRLAAITQAVCP
jgi:hypothetical protein